MKEKEIVYPGECHEGMYFFPDGALRMPKMKSFMQISMFSDHAGSAYIVPGHNR